MDTEIDIYDFILKYLVCPWEKSGTLSFVAILFSIAMIMLVIITISLNRINDFYKECEKSRQFIYTACATLIPCFAILLPIYFYIPAVILSMYEIHKREKVELQKLHKDYNVESDFSIVYKSVKASAFVELFLILISSIVIVLVLHFIGFGYHFEPVLPI